MNFYGFTEQVSTVVFLASTRKKAKVEFNGFRFKYVLVNPGKFFGYRKERISDFDFLYRRRGDSLGCETVHVRCT